MSYAVYVCDTETTGLDAEKNDVIEVCFWRLGEPESRTWHMKPFNPENIQEIQTLKLEVPLPGA